jgi:HD-GYP domain-containing protein (c-di-GMP phosphodiesterase class II)/DNA-binding CsgD family transcriptional regulator
VVSKPGDNEWTGRVAELIAALSLATDLGMGQPLEQTIDTCLVAVKAGRSLGLAESTLSDVYYLALLRFVGCTADAHESAAAVGGDEIALRSGLAAVLMADMPDFMGFMLGHYASDQPTLRRLRFLLGALADGTRTPKRSIAEHCEVAQMLAARLGIRAEVAGLIGTVFERWDGKGLPGLLAGEAIPIAARVVSVARDVDIFRRLGGWPLVNQVLRRRRGRAYDPSVTDVFLEGGEAWLLEISDEPAWDAVLAAEPGEPALIEPEKIQGVLSAFADFADLKSPFTLGHSTRVAALAADAARVLGLSDREAENVRWAGLVHDLGKTGIPNGIWDKTGTLSSLEWERVRLHPYLTERILTYASPLRSLAPLAGAHHERLDGSGYHKGSAGALLTSAARVLAAADAYDAMGQARPYREPLDRQERERELRREVAAGKLDSEAVSAVLSIAGHSVAPVRHSWPAGLTDREVEVLRLVSIGHSKREVASRLTISVKTVGRHVENIYVKIGVSGRAAAALFAMEHQLIHS